jgi:putrescine transport system ATP-binding protein
MSSSPLLVKNWLDPDAKPFIEFRGVTKLFDGVPAVRDVNLSIYQKELFCLLGGSGSGKTTLLRMLAGFEAPTEGSVWIDGVDITKVPAYERPVNMMFQSYALFPHMTVFDNVAYGLKRDGLPKAQIAERVAELLDLVRLSAYAKRKPDQLSGGQRQRVALARALAKRPKVLLLDEPLGALDKNLREDTQLELIKIQESLGMTFIVVTHDQEEAMTLATRIGVMDEGYLVQTDEPHTIYEYPNSTYVADFIGDINLFECVVTENDTGNLVLSAPQLETTIDLDDPVTGAVNQTLWYAIRPEKMRLARDPSTAVNALKGVVHEIAYLGDFSVYWIDLANGFRVRVSRPNISRMDDFAEAWGEEVWITWDGSAGVVLSQ